MCGLLSKFSKNYTKMVNRFNPIDKGMRAQLSYNEIIKTSVPRKKDFI